jgi:ABC-type glycerol-3-phosphate transport system substrate-binding protein
MQPLFARKPAPNARRAPLLLVAATALAACGCPGNKPTVGPVVVAKPHAGVTLTVSCPDPALAAVLAPAARNWGTRSGATVTVSNGPAGDILVLPARAFGAACANGQFAPLPAGLRDPGHPFVMSGLPDAVTEGLAGWAGRPTGVLLGLDAAVLVYRKDRFDDTDARNTFRTTFRRDLAPPASWEDTVAVATFFREKDGTPSLGPLPKDPAALLDLFHRIAACTDRPAVTPSNTVGRKLNDRAFAAEAVSFHFDYATGQPRLTTPGFAMAADLLRQLQPCRPADGPEDPVAALEAGAVLAVCTMADVARLPKGPDGAVAPRFGIAKLPGTKRFFDSLTKAVASVGGTEANAVPYYSGGRVGAVTKACANPQAAFDLLADWGGPDGAGRIVGEPAVGSGPWRGSLLEANKRSLWLGYGLSATETDNLLRALRPFVATDLRNPVLAPRGPGLDPLLAALEKQVRLAATGAKPPEAAMATAQGEWETLEKANGPDAPKWRKADMRGE